MSGHTELPQLRIADKDWLLHPFHWNTSIVATVDGKTTLVAESDDRYAAQFVTACNSHAELVKALEEIRDNTHGIPDWKALEICRTKARAALATLTARKVG